MQNNQDKLNNLNKHLKMAEKINKTCKSVLLELRSTDYKTMAAFRPYIGPKANIKKLLDFYDLYTAKTKALEKIRIMIEKSGIQTRPMKIKELEEMGIIKSLDEFRDCLHDLEEYKEVKIVEEITASSTKFFNEIVECIKKAFFAGLNRLPKIVNKIDVYAHFLLQNCNKKEFLGEYTQKVYERLGFIDINNNLALLVQQTANLTKYFNLVIQMNAEILGKRASYNINVGLVQLIIISLKKVMADTLLKVDKRSKAADIPLLIKLHGNLRKKDNTVKEIEELYVFRDQIKKLILNCVIQLMADLEMLETPRADLQMEEVCKTTTAVLDAFNENSDLKADWIKSFGPSFGIYNTEAFNSNLSNKCLTKITELSKQLKDFDKYVYLINNKILFADYIDLFENLSITKSISKDRQLIIGLWKIKLESYKGLVLNRYLSNELSQHTKYLLPEKERLQIQEALKTIVENFIVRKIIEGKTNHLKDAIEKTYTGTSQE